MTWAQSRLVRLPADDEGLDIIPAIAVGGVRDALLELSEELGEETGSARLTLAREGTEEKRPSPCSQHGQVTPVRSPDMRYGLSAPAIVSAKEGCDIEFSGRVKSLDPATRTGVVLIGAKSGGRKIFGLATLNVRFR